MKGFGDQNKVKKKPKKSSGKTKPSKEKIINQAFQFHAAGNIPEAVKYYQYFINQGFNDCRVFSNYGIILRDLGKLKDAEIFTRKAIELNPNFADAHSNLGNLLKDLGKLQEAEKSYRKAIELNPDFANASCNLGIILRDLGKLQEAEIYTRKAIELNPNYAEAHNNLGNIFKDLGELKDAEKSYCKAIELNPNYANAYYNLGNVLRDLSNLKEAEIYTRKAVEINPNFAKAYYSLSLFKYSANKKWEDRLFTENILINKSKKEQVDIYFARANIFHRKRNYEESSKYLKLANNLKLDLYPSNADTHIKKSKTLLIASDKTKIKNKEHKSYSESIFIVGMPRSGSTLVESILSVSSDVCDLGEILFVGDLFTDCENSKQYMNLAELYTKKVNDKTTLKKTTNKNLYNYLYAGIISNQIPNSKIIHCFRNPLDNILSIYRAHFANGNTYSSSLVDCAKIYLDQENLMSEYKNRYRTNIYDLNYDSLVSNPNQQIKSLLSWLGWEWNDAYLSPHLNPRSISTASSIQVRSPINTKSINGWKQYKKMLKPAMEIITQTNKYKKLKY